MNEVSDDREFDAVYIAGNVREVSFVERLLTEEGIEYAVRPETFHHAVGGGACFQGLLFEVLAGQAEYTRKLLISVGLRKGIIPREPEATDMERMPSA